MDATTLQVREATAGDLDAIADIYASLWCRRMMAAGQADDALLCARFCSVIQLRRSQIPLVAVDGSRVVAACLIGTIRDGAPVPNPLWHDAYQELLVAATERAKTADDDLEGSLFGDSREMAYGDRFIATGSEYAQAQLNLIIVLPEYQGLGVGSRLMSVARAKMAERGAEKFFLTTDSSSDVSFYDHIGMKRISESHEQDTGDGFTTYIYGGQTA